MRRNIIKKRVIMADLVQEKQEGFNSKLGFILAAAGAAVGLGSIWRFPYLAAQYGGIFLIVYIFLMVTIGFSLTKMEIAFGRRTYRNVLDAYGTADRRFKWAGILALLCPLIVIPYYCVIGGWTIKYAVSYLDLKNAVQEIGNNASYFKDFTSETWIQILFFAIFALCTAAVIMFGVGDGIEKISIILMPVLIVLCTGIAIFVVCQDGAWEGVKYYLIPRVEGMDAGDIFSMLSTALAQLFFSLSLAMGVMVTYGAFMKKETSIASSSRWIGAFVIFVAFAAGMIIIPAVFAFSGDPHEVLNNSGSALLFEQMPKVFLAMADKIGGVGSSIVAALFFLLVFFAALTSSISIMDVVVEVVKTKLKTNRVKATLIVFGITVLLGLPCVFGYNIWSGATINKLTILDMYDWASANLIMPVLEFILCLQVGWFMDKHYTQDELGLIDGKASTKYYNIMIKYVGPIAMLIVLVVGLI